MNEYVLIYRGGQTREERSPAELDASIKRWQAWFAKLGEEGKLKDWGIPLQSAGKQVAAGGIVTDGPYSEGKEVIGGFSVIIASDLAEAAEIAKDCPTFLTGGSVEVRPVIPM